MANCDSSQINKLVSGYWPKANSIYWTKAWQLIYYPCKPTLYLCGSTTRGWAEYISPWAAKRLWGCKGGVLGDGRSGVGTLLTYSDVLNVRRESNVVMGTLEIWRGRGMIYRNKIEVHAIYKSELNTLFSAKIDSSDQYQYSCTPVNTTCSTETQTIH